MVTGTLETVMQTARAVMASLALSYEIDSGESQNLDELYCMAQNVYFESRHEPMLGKIAVAHVVMNRIEDKRWPGTVCEVVKEGPVRESWKTKKDPNLPKEERVYYPRKNRCQFSWYCDGKVDDVKNKRAYRESDKIAFLAIESYNAIKTKGLDLTEGARYYHTYAVSPKWSKVYPVVGRIGEHIFYR